MNIFDVDKTCEDCPYDDFKARQWRKETLSDRKYADSWQPEYLWCDKVGGKHWMCGYCGDCYEDYSPSKDVVKKHIRPNHYDNLIKYKKKSIKNACTSDICEDYYYDDSNYFNRIKKDENGNFYAQKRSVSNLRKYCKKQTNRKFRKTNVGNYGAYRKLFDYWYTLF